MATTVEKSVRTISISTRNRHLVIEKVIIYVLLIMVAGLVLLPMLWSFAASFTPNNKVFEYASPFSLRAFLPVALTLEAYTFLFEHGFARSLANSFLLGMVVVFIGGLVNALAGFAFARFD